MCLLPSSPSERRMLFGLMARMQGLQMAAFAWTPSGPPQRVHVGRSLPSLRGLGATYA